MGSHPKDPQPQIKPGWCGNLRLPIDKVFPLEDADAAQRRMRANEHFGKILLRSD